MKKLVILACAILSILFVFGCTTIEKNKCNDLDEQSCRSMAGCRPNYTTGPCSFGICGHSAQFSGCTIISEDELKQNEVNQQLCGDTNGVWTIDNWSKGQYCSCLTKNYYLEGFVKFNEIDGCISEKDLCKKEGGFWEPSQKKYYQSMLKDSMGVFVPITIADCSKISNSKWREEYSDCEVIDAEKGSYVDNPKCVLN